MAYNEKARATRAANQAAKKAAQEAAKVDLAAEVAALKAKLAEATAAKTEPTFHVKLGEQMAATEAEKPKAPPPNLFSGNIPRLAVYGKNGDTNDPIPGFKLYWFNDIEGGYRINMARQSGWEFVQNDEIAINDTQTGGANSDLGSHVRRFVENGPGGTPVYAFLMKKPKWLHELHEYGPDSREQRIHQKVEAELRQGTLNQQPGDGRYTPGNMPAGLPASTLGSSIKIEHKVG